MARWAGPCVRRGLLLGFAVLIAAEAAPAQDDVQVPAGPTLGAPAPRHGPLSVRRDLPGRPASDPALRNGRAELLVEGRGPAKARGVHGGPRRLAPAIRGARQVRDGEPRGLAPLSGCPGLARREGEGKPSPVHDGVEGRPRVAATPGLSRRARDAGRHVRRRPSRRSAALGVERRHARAAALRHRRMARDPFGVEPFRRKRLSLLRQERQRLADAGRA